MKKELVLGFFLLLTICCTAYSKCKQSCDLALASYYVWDGAVLGYIAEYLNASMDDIVAYNNATITNKDNLPSGVRIHVPFSCDCINGEFLGHVFTYQMSSGDTCNSIASRYYANLTTAEWLQKFNSYQASSIPETAVLNITVNCSCGDSSVSKDYGLFETYPLRPSQTLASIANRSGVSADLLRRYNPNSNFGAGSGLVYIPAKDKNGNFVPLKSSTGLGSEVIAGISVAGVVGILLLSSCIYIGFYRKKKAEKITPLTKPSQAPGCTRTRYPQPRSPAIPESNCFATTSIIVHKSVEFSYEELAKATDNFSLANKIGQGGFGAVYYAELRGEKAAIKKMNMKASKEFLAELRVLTHVHHLNLVCLIGYCTERSLFLVYEFIENGNLSQHLHSSEREPLPWSRRMQIALDSARGLEYIHEHTVPVYIHRDIKSANILIDNNFCAKVADFGLTKLTRIGSTLPLSVLVGTFGYMPPEYAQFGNVSPKVDVYAFGVVLYELISAKAAVINTNEVTPESQPLVALFREVLTQSDQDEGLRKLIDPRLEDKYPFESVFKLAQLARACTQEMPESRPSMRSVVVALMALSSPTEDWDAESFYEFS